MVTNTHLRSLGFDFRGKEKHLRLNHGDYRRLVIRGNRLFLIDRYDCTSSYEQDYDLRFQAMWNNCISFVIGKMSLSKFDSLVKAIKEGQWFTKLK